MTEPVADNAQDPIRHTWGFWDSFSLWDGGRAILYVTTVHFGDARAFVDELRQLASSGIGPGQRINYECRNARNDFLPFERSPSLYCNCDHGAQAPCLAACGLDGSAHGAVGGTGGSLDVR